MIKSTGIDFFTFYATTGAEKCNHQLVVATTGAFTLTSVSEYDIRAFAAKIAFEAAHYYDEGSGETVQICRLVRAFAAYINA